jgi:tetratricopeptide (TPR) repeat protein
MAEFRRALALDPKFSLAHFNLGLALRDKGQLDEAITEYRQAIRHEPDFAGAHCNLGQVLQLQGRFEESLACLQRGHALGSKQPRWRYPSAQWVRDAEHLLALNAKLPAVLSGQQSPANVEEAWELAWLCQQPYKKRYAASARLYAEAFAAEPKVAADLNQHHRYNAAWSAALAAAGQGEDARLLPDKVVTMFRRWALGWLRDDLTAYAQLAQQNNPALQQVIQQRLAHWRRDPDLASVRDAPAQDHLAEDERAAWQALWRDVDELAARLKKADGSAVPKPRDPAAGGPPRR